MLSLKKIQNGEFAAAGGKCQPRYDGNLGLKLMFFLLLNYAKVDNIGRKTIRQLEKAGSMFNFRLKYC